MEIETILFEDLCQDRVVGENMEKRIPVEVKKCPLCIEGETCGLCRPCHSSKFKDCGWACSNCPSAQLPEECHQKTFCVEQTQEFRDMLCVCSKNKKD